MLSPVKFLTIMLVVFCPMLTNVADGQSLFGIQVDAPKASQGQYVLCPSQQFYEAALKKGADKTTFIYYAARMVEQGEKSSRVRNLAGQNFVIPNELVVSIPPGQTAKVGDIVLSWWQSGSGMQRCIVVGGTATEPVVRYLDVDLENPSGVGKKEESLMPDSFVKLTEPWQAGSTASFKTARGEKFGQILAMDESKFLAKSFGGKLTVFDRSSATPISIPPIVKPGDLAEATIFGTMKPVTVKSVDARNGRVLATYTFGNSEKEKAFAFGEIRAVK